MSLDHEPRTHVNNPETSDKPAWYKRRSTKIGGAAAAVAGLVAAGALTLGGNSTEADHPRANTHTGATPTPGGETSPQPSPTTSETQPADSEYVFDSNVVTVPKVEVESLNSDQARQEYYASWYNSIDADRLEKLALKNSALKNEVASESDDVKFMLIEPMTNPNASNSYTKADYLDDLNAEIAFTSEVLSQPQQLPSKQYAEVYDKYTPDMSDSEFHLSQTEFNDLMKKAEQDDASAQTELYKHLVGWSQNYATLSQTIMLSQLADRVRQGLNDGSAEDQNTVAGIINKEKAMIGFGTTGDLKQEIVNSNEQFLYEGYPENNQKSLAATYADKNVKTDDFQVFFNSLPTLVEKKDILKGTTAKVLDVKSINVDDASNVGDNLGGDQAENSACQIIFEVTDDLGTRQVVKVETGPAPLQGGEADKSVVGWIAEIDTLPNE
ncbi:MAG TPA: hypothetical protein VFL81_01890 [Candidatus Saccharimonadales bacterium]|nr:hypothetical protein [Candidatus Saccharimonadales bacterium]